MRRWRIAIAMAGLEAVDAPAWLNAISSGSMSVCSWAPTATAILPMRYFGPTVYAAGSRKIRNRAKSVYA